ncbi:SMP-30/gluconolactonase/LRE family protein [Paracoccus sp. M683]|uniref:SMP-30/gluconolactonase/LRE family protein n=1 Tax=Paracoccus sp. M683 TaxID=2594268 RepID=UPI0011806E1E|nr:SMP-30/gluconolactonase/LRE family protein [Paracoccus sp. M683]TRW95180.1 SMP-30/gluconolactonase/LRE family protein [Paracoccus sp. M683]
MITDPAISVFDDRRCALGEGPFWHPERGQAFWFDILGRRMLGVDGSARQHWQFDEYVSAAGWIDRDRLLVASQTALTVFDLVTGRIGQSWPLEAGNVLTRSNDGRADPMGGFWIGTMSINKPRGQRGAIYRFYRGEIRKLYDRIGVSNAICFAPDGRTAYYADTDTSMIMRQTLDAEGWPAGPPAVFVDLTAEKLRPDGAVVDSDGNLWNAQFGAARVVCYGADGAMRRVIEVPARQTTCPAFIGADLDRLMITTAAEGQDGPSDGMTFVIDGLQATGQAEYRVKLN